VPGQAKLAGAVLRMSGNNEQHGMAWNYCSAEAGVAPHPLTFHACSLQKRDLRL
jgi:hypothetical protein